MVGGIPLSREEIDDRALVAPAVSVIVAELARRPAWQHDRPLAVPSDLWFAARDEMKAIMAKRGFPLAASGAVKSEHFLIQGVPIVLHG